MAGDDLTPGAPVTHPRHGRGVVQAVADGMVFARFGAALEAVPLADLRVERGPLEQLAAGGGDPLEAVVRVQAQLIRSVNDAWGIFNRSRIQLLPHQLWVCRQVTRRWPTRWLVADDVGLGKTVEAGLIVSSFKLAGRLDRLLIVCPASLVEQWQERMREMFGIHCAAYSAEADTPRSGFWQTHPFVVASMHTLRKDARGRHDRMREADPWDLVLIDEAHHLNADPQRGETLGLRLVKDLEERGKIRSMVFFTGTPHRGKDFGFVSLLSVLRPDLFTPVRGAERQDLSGLREVMIRNNKQRVTDLEGQPLFQHPRVTPRAFAFSEEERAFYDRMTLFVESGEIYARKLGEAYKREAVKLVLVSLQKLASSSAAAVLHALINRRQKLAAEQALPSAVLKIFHGVEDGGDGAGEAEEAVAAAGLDLVADEARWLDELIGLGGRIDGETKLREIIRFVRSLPTGESVLFFTEYKATQSAVMGELHRAFGDGCCAFINGDRIARGVAFHGDAGPAFRDLRQDRGTAVAAFNSGGARFLVSTEAAGEGIDLQERCHTLVHVDLPWNPMRLHQRVGRLNRYGQKRRVEVTYFHNPDTLESRIWEILFEKIERITEAYAEAMDDPEDVADLVMGVEGGDSFASLLAEAAGRAGSESLEDWHDRVDGTFGGEDAVDLVRTMLGGCQRFDFGRDAKQLPRLDLFDLEPFFVSTLRLHQRRPSVEDGRLGFKAPEAWLRGNRNISRSYRGLHFDRGASGREEKNQLIGVGLAVFDRAVAEGLRLDAAACVLPSDRFSGTLLVFRVYDRRTGSAGGHAACCGVLLGTGRLLRDWELLQLLNDIEIPRKPVIAGPAAVPEASAVQRASEQARDAAKELGVETEFSAADLLAVISGATNA